MACEDARTARSRPASTKSRRACSAVTAIAAVAAVLLVAPAGAAAKVHTLRPVRSHAESLVFRLAGIEPKTIVAARLYRGHRLVRTLNLRRVRAAARRGYLRVKLARVHRRARARAAHHRPGHIKVVTDTTPPETTITSGPTGTVSAQDASFASASSEAGPPSSAGSTARPGPPAARPSSTPASPTVFTGSRSGRRTRRAT